MKKILDWIKNNPNRTMFLVPILLVAGISISHVVSWYDIANPINWAIYLSIAVEVGAMTALVAATNRIKGGVWFMFGLVTFIQMIGNIFYSFKEIDVNGDLFKSWVELTGPIWEIIGSDTTDISSMKRWLAFLEGGLLPIISLTSLHFFVKYDVSKETVVNQIQETIEVKEQNEPPLNITEEKLSEIEELLKKYDEKYKESETEPQQEEPLEDNEKKEEVTYDAVIEDPILKGKRLLRYIRPKNKK